MSRAPGMGLMKGTYLRTSVTPKHTCSPLAMKALPRARPTLPAPMMVIMSVLRKRGEIPTQYKAPVRQAICEVVDSKLDCFDCIIGRDIGGDHRLDIAGQDRHRRHRRDGLHEARRHGTVGNGMR